MPNLIGFINIDKPLNMTSSDVVVKVRKALSNAVGEKVTTGHLGTLDPLASGVLPIAVGKATRLFDLSLKKSKIYVAKFTFGKTTDTLDSARKVTETSNVLPTRAQIEAILSRFIGEIEQYPPQYSAKSVNGVRAYKLARSGQSVELKAAKVTIFQLSILSQLSTDTFEFLISCGSGTYVRSIVRDIAEAVGTVGYMSGLRRTKSGEFCEENAVSLDDFLAEPLKYLLPVSIMLERTPVISLSTAELSKALNGVAINVQFSDGQYRIDYENQIIALGTVTDNILKLTTRLLSNDLL